MTEVGGILCEILLDQVIFNNSCDISGLVDLRVAGRSNKVRLGDIIDMSMGFVYLVVTENEVIMWRAYCFFYTCSKGPNWRLDSGGYKLQLSISDTGYS